MRANNKGRRPIPLLYHRLALLLVLLSPSAAPAFGGFFVGSNGRRVSTATVVMMRSNATTVLSIRVDRPRYPDQFALVIPVPATFEKAHVKVLPHAVFERVERLAAPRLRAFLEKDPCFQSQQFGCPSIPPRPPHCPYRWVESAAQDESDPKFVAGEYAFTLINGGNTRALRDWFDQHQLTLPDNAEDHLRPYVARGMQFLVAHADLSEQSVEDRRPRPIRVHFDSDTFTLPIGVSRINSAGFYNLTMYVLGIDQRFTVASRHGVTIPTRLTVAPTVLEQFDTFYGNLRDKTLQKNPGAVVTEFAGPAIGCDGCLGSGLTVSDLKFLGADVALSTRQETVINVERPLVWGGLTPDAVQAGTQREMRRLRRCVRLQALMPLGEMRMRYPSNLMGPSTGRRLSRA
ncbi:MAG: hypothetical protein ACI9U2_001823 [Bradymonadia bacterium]